MNQPNSHKEKQMVALMIFGPFVTLIAVQILIEKFED